MLTDLVFAAAIMQKEVSRMTIQRRDDLRNLHSTNELKGRPTSRVSVTPHTAWFLSC